MTRMAFWLGIVVCLLFLCLLLGVKRAVLFTGVTVFGFSGWLFETFNNNLMLVPSGNMGWLLASAWLFLVLIIQLIKGIVGFISPFKREPGFIFFTGFLLTGVVFLFTVLFPEQQIGNSKYVVILIPVAIMFCSACLTMSIFRIARSAFQFVFWAILAISIGFPVIKDASSFQEISGVATQIQPRIQEVLTHGKGLFSSQEG